MFNFSLLFSVLAKSNIKVHSAASFISWQETQFQIILYHFVKQMYSTQHSTVSWCVKIIVSRVHICFHLCLVAHCRKWFELCFNPNLVTLKKLVILLPGAFFGTFIINQFTWSLFWQFWYLIMHWFIFKKLVILLPGAFFGTFKKN